MKIQKSKAREYLDKDREFILWIFDNRCIKCGKRTNVIHEIVPISHGKSSLNWRNRVPLCQSFDDDKSCHDWAHRSTKISIPFLQNKRREFIIKKFM